jgi:hypothetical protein
MITNNETVLQFDYKAMSDGLWKRATFPKATLCGWSITSKGHPERREMNEVTSNKICPILSRIVPFENIPDDFHLWEIYCLKDECQLWISTQERCGMVTYMPRKKR